MGSLRYFFWSTAISGCLLIVGVMTGTTKKMFTTLTAVRAQGFNGLAPEYREKVPLILHDYLPTIVKRKIPCNVWVNADRLTQVNYLPDRGVEQCLDLYEAAGMEVPTFTKPGASPTGGPSAKGPTRMLGSTGSGKLGTLDVSKIDPKMLENFDPKTLENIDPRFLQGAQGKEPIIDPVEEKILKQIEDDR